MSGRVESEALQADTARAAPIDFDAVYRAWFHPVERWLRAFGVAESELPDVAQEVFLVVQAKLDRFNGRNLPGWLYAIAARCASDHRRGAWFRRLFRRPREVELDAMPAAVESPERAAERGQDRRRLRAVLDRMSPDRRATFYLFEIEGYSGEEIAALTDVPVATVWTRLHRARKEFVELVARLDREGTR